MNLSIELQAAAQRAADKIALIDGERSLSHRELAQTAYSLARRFLAEGLRHGDRVAIHAPNSIETVLVVLACFHAGLVAVPINVRFKPEEVGYILGHCRARLLYVDPALAAPLTDTLARVTEPMTVWTQLPRGGETAAPGPPDADLPALILYTSGTTARPKGVTHTLRTLSGTTRTMFGVGIDGSTVMLIALSMMHTAGMCAMLLPTLVQGGTAVLLPKFDPAMVLDAVQQHRCSWTLILPALMQAVAVEQERSPRDLSSMRCWLSGGDSVAVSLQERWRRLADRPLSEGYAMSESLIMTYNRPEAIRPGSIGKAAEGVEIAVLDEEFNRVKPGVVGQIASRSPANFVGYWEDPKATAGATGKGWMLTGDLGRLDEEGYVWFHGRLKEIIIRAGSNISPQEVEEALLSHPEVLEAGVIGVPDEATGERVQAFVALREGGKLEERELMAFARRTLADYKVPECILFIPTLPKGITGKVQRRALKELVGPSLSP